MILTVTGRQIELGSAVRLQIEKRLARVQRLLNDSAVSAQCVVAQERQRFMCEVTLHARGDHMLVGVGRHDRLITAVGLAVDKVAQQAQRLSDRWKTRKRTARVVPAAMVADVPAEPRVRVIRSRRYAIKPMTVDDAILALTDAEQQFLVFRDTTSEAIAVLFKRPDGHFGLIDTEG